MPLVIVDRQTWGAAPPRMSTLLETPVTNVFVTCAVTPLCTGDQNCIRAVQRLQKYQVDRITLPDIQYNFCIAGNGRVYEGRGWNSRATLLKRHRLFTNTSLFIAFLGKNLDIPERRNVLGRMLKGLHELLVYGVRKQFITPRFLLFNNSCINSLDAIRPAA